MNRSLFFILFLFVTQYIHAAVDSVFFITPDVLDQNNIYLSSSNPTRLMFNDISRYNTANIQYRHNDGGFHPINTSGRNNIYAVDALSYLKMGNFFLRGNARFESVNSYDVKWSSSATNNDYLVSIGDSIAGLQRGEHYLLGAEVGYKINKLWSIGAGLDYLAFTNNKQVDPRNSNKGISIRMNPGIMYTGNGIQIGATLLYKYENEDISYMKDGDQEKDVFSIFPLWFYKSESLQKGGIKRYCDRYDLGGAVLLGNAGSSNFVEYAVEFKGKKEFQTIFHNKVMDERGGEGEGVSCSLNGQMQINTESFKHKFSVNLSNSNLIGFDNIQQLAVVEGVTKWVQYGRIKKSKVNNKDLNFCYSLARPVTKWFNSDEAGVLIHLSNANKYFSIYPLQYSQDYSQYLIGSFYKKNKEFDKSVLNLSLSLHAQFGGGSPLEKRMLENQETPQITLKQDYNNLIREFDYNTATSSTVSLYSRYLYQINRDIALFGSCSALLKHATTTSYKGNSFLALDISFGIVFR